MADGEVAANNGNGGEEGGGGGGMMRMMLQMVMFSMVLNMFKNRNTQPSQPEGLVQELSDGDGSVQTMQGKQGISGNTPVRNLYGGPVECDLLVHLLPASFKGKTPTTDLILDDEKGSSKGLVPLWQTKIWYEDKPEAMSVNVSLPPFALEILAGDGSQTPYIMATMIKSSLKSEDAEIPEEHVITSIIPLVQMWRELNPDAAAENLFGGDDVVPVTNASAATKIPYFKTRIEIRPVYDMTVHTLGSVQQGPFKKLVIFPELGVYQPFLYVSDFWLLEKDYTALNETLSGQRLNLTLDLSSISLWAWSLQMQMAEQWMVQGDWGMTDTQRDSFMLKRLITDTNPYLLAFSGAFIALHTVFGLLAFKNDIQFWRHNESMQGLSARSMIVSFICQFITCLYLLDSQQASRLILFEIVLDLALATWKLKKAVKIELTRTFPFVTFGGQKGYENNNTNKLDDQAFRYMLAVLMPMYLGYAVKSLVYGKHRSFYSFLVSTAAGGVYTFGFIMMTPQLYINYKLQSVEHLPWRALTYKAMNTFVDDIAAVLIDMPMMHRLSCFRDDIIFFVLVYQRWKYRVDKSRPTMYGERPADFNPNAPVALTADTADRPTDEKAD